MTRGDGGKRQIRLQVSAECWSWLTSERIRRQCRLADVIENLVRVARDSQEYGRTIKNYTLDENGDPVLAVADDDPEVAAALVKVAASKIAQDRASKGLDDPVLKTKRRIEELKESGASFVPGLTKQEQFGKKKKGKKK